MDDIRQAHCKGDHDGQKDAIRNAQSVLDELIGSLNFSYPISHNLYKLYMFCKNELSRAMYENRLDGVQEAEHIMHRLYTSFVEVAKQDKSAPLMKKYPAGICRDDLCARRRKRRLYGCGQSPGLFLYKISVKMRTVRREANSFPLLFFTHPRRNFIAHLYGFCLINVIVDQIRINDIFKIGIGILQFCGCLFQIIEKYCIAVRGLRVVLNNFIGSPAF